MNETEAYERLLLDPVWGPEVRIIAELPESEDSRPVLVGGAVRDLLLGREITDLDMAASVPGTARSLALAFAESTGRTLVEYVHQQAIYRVVSRDAPQVDFTDPVGGSRESDLTRRDFTINALALGIAGDEAGVIFDPTGGMSDLEDRVISMTSPEVFDDDPLRLLRAFRFMAQLGFDIEPDTLRAIQSRALKLRDVAGERIQLELLGILEPHGAVDRIVKMDSVSLLRPLFPELGMQKGVEQNDYHHLDVWEHTLEAVRIIEKVLDLDDPALDRFRDSLTEYIDFTYQSGHSRRALIKLATLLHDIAKPHCRDTREDGRVTFIGHERRGSDLCNEHLSKLKFPSYERDFVCTIIEAHLRPGSISHHGSEKPRVAFKFFRDCGEASTAVILMSLADRLSAQGTRITEEHNERHRETARFLLDALYNKTDVMVRPPQLIDGGELIHELNLEPGPLIGLLLRKVQEAQVMNEVASREEALELCRNIISESGL